MPSPGSTRCRRTASWVANQQVATRLAERVVAAGGRLHLAEPVRAIAWTPDGGRTDSRGGGAPVVVRTDAGQVEADAVVLAVPLTVLRELELTPALPEPKRAALDVLGVGQAAKLHLALATPVEPFAVTAVPDRFWCWAASDGRGDGPSVVASFTGSRPALDGLAVTDGPARWASLLRAAVPEVDVDDTVEPLLSTWQDDPWAGLAYSAVLVGPPPDVDAIAAPVGPLHFAGEHTAGDLAGLMEGALRSGARAAAEIG